MKLSKEQILAAVEIEETQAYGYLTGDLAAERAENLDYYNGEPFGDEEEGRSQVVLTEVADVIEGVLPGLCKIFAGSDQVLKFEPRNGEDVAAAEQETEYCNYVITQKNPWFQIFYVWAKDALLQKNGYVKFYWENYSDVAEETYHGLTDDELTMLMQDPEIEIIGHDAESVIEMTLAGQIEMNVHNIKVKRVNKYGKVCIENVPPEELLVSTKCRTPNPKDADFVEHRTRKTISELRQSGFDVPDSIGDDFNGEDYEAIHRDLYAENDQWNDNTSDPAMRRVWVREVYMRLDADGDGIAELNRIVIVGREILDMQTVPFIPFAALTPYIVPHRHIGKAMADMVKDMQLIKSKVLRNELDGAYYALHGRHAINEDRVDLDDMLTSRPNGIVRVKGDPAGAIIPLNSSHQIGQGFPMLEYLDTIKENRTGVTKYNQGTDANSLNKTATGITKIMSAAQDRQLLIARVFAETGVKELFMGVHAMTRMYQNKQEVIRLRNKWVPVDPRDWAKRADMTVSVGLGTGDKDQQLMHLQMIGSYMQQAIQVGVVTPKNVYNLGAKIIENAGYKLPEEFITDPESGQLPPQQPDPKVVEAQAKLKLEQEKMQMEAQSKLIDADIEGKKAAQEMQIKQIELEHQMRLEEMRAMHQMQLEREKMEMQAQIEREKMALQQQTTLFNHEANKEIQGIPQGGSLQQMLQELQQSVSEALEGAKQEMVVHLTAPKRIERDPKTGKAIAVNGKPIERDQNGRMIGF